MTNYYGIIVAAGTSQRFAGKRPKQYEYLGNKTLLEHSISHMLSIPHLQKLIVVLHEQDSYWQTLTDAHYPLITTATGGITRADSVVNGLNNLVDLAQADDFVLIHDAARPYLKQEDLLTLIAKTEHHPIGGILAAPVVDTIKFSQDGQHIDKTIPRQQLYRALTPQCFRFAKLLQAYQHALAKQIELTDDAMAMELAGYHPLLIPGDSQNLKITYLSDMPNNSQP